MLCWSKLDRENERLDALLARLDALDAEPAGRQTVTITQYREVVAIKGPGVAATTAGRTLNVITTTRQPARAYTAAEGLVAETGSAFEHILGRLRSMYTARHHVRLEVGERSSLPRGPPMGRRWRVGA